MTDEERGKRAYRIAEGLHKMGANPIPQPAPMWRETRIEKASIVLAVVAGLVITFYFGVAYYRGADMLWPVSAFAIGVFLGMAFQEDFLTPAKLRKLAEQFKNRNAARDADAP